MDIPDTNKIIPLSIKLWLATTLLLALMHSSSAFAFQREYFPVPGDYALEMVDDNGKVDYMNVTAAKGEVWVTYKFKQLPGWQKPAEQTATPYAIQFKCRREDDAIKVDVTLVMRPLQISSRNTVVTSTLPEDGLKGKPIGSHSARLGEEMAFRELAEYGIEPFSVKVVSANARQADLSEIDNRTKAIEIVRVDEARGRYLLAIKNISSKKIITGSIAGPKNGSESFDKRDSSYIAPGEVIDFGVSL